LDKARKRSLIQAPIAAPDRVNWKHYKHRLPEHVYDVYMRYWKNVEFSRAEYHF